MLKIVLAAITVLFSHQILLADAGCNCQATNQMCTQTCGIGLVQCIYGCESTPTDACTNACLDIYWPIFESGQDSDIELPFVKRDSDPTVMPSGHHRDEDDYGEKNRGSHGDDSHSSHNGGKEKGEGPFEFPPDEDKHFDDVYDNLKNGPKEEFYPKDDFGPREGYRNRSMATTSEAFTKATISIIAFAIASACIVAF